MTLQVTPGLLRTVALENARSLGPVDEEVAREIGIIPFGDLPDQPFATDNWAEKVADKDGLSAEPLQHLTEFICGDCVVPVGTGICGHDDPRQKPASRKR